MIHRDVIVIGAGAAGLFCAAQAGQRGRNVEVLDHAKKVGRKILMSGGGRCNFTNMYTTPENFLCSNPHFCKSALSRYTQWDFVGLVAQYGIAYHEKTLGQLFCDDSATDIVNMLLSECEKAHVKVSTRCEILNVEKNEQGFVLQTSLGDYRCESLVIATGGLSLPKLGASAFGYRLAEQFGLKVLPTRAGLVPFTLQDADKATLAELSGIAVDVQVSCNSSSFRESMLFTHRGLSGPAMLQISSFWQPGDVLSINAQPEQTIATILEIAKEETPEALLSTVLGKLYPKRFVQTFIALYEWKNTPVKQLNAKDIEKMEANFSNWQIKPNGTEGYRTAEVTLGGVDTNELSSKTMMAKNVDGLFFIGEVVDVTGWLGGFNFQWAWSSGWAAGQYV
ncbi:NAD(P)/FAD-dependent oxidoreductase [Alteromonas pelagimontana]|uniref:NAD(P)/FAD-dependent oxidoreductase n=1 Tax=Alteromonas pelagimontana TaxID=1858656 RepID=A0A6M4MD84_9ALTE|nr:NAD(P)/FAD-dependent oxidoreductase [Alteromonas pelagimontana]QJR81151.1 NAD(P)/FAD-dependent oxidoreductase [Alteromonas pelagimontana]